MNDNQPNERPDYGVRLTGDDLAAHQQKYQAHRAAQAGQSGNEYGQQGQQLPASSEYGPQGDYPPQPGNGQYPEYATPGTQQGFQQQSYQQPGFQQAHHGQPFGGPQIHPDMAHEPERPKSVSLSFWSILAAGVFYVLSQLVIAALPNRGYTAADIQLLEDLVGDMMVGMPFDSIEGYLNSSMMTAAIVGQGIVFFVAYVLVALGIRHGWRSMRIIATICAVLSLLNLSFVTPLVAVLSGVAVFLGIVGVVYAWLPSTTEYFRKKAWQKAAKRAYPDAPSR